MGGSMMSGRMIANIYDSGIDNQIQLRRSTMRKKSKFMYPQNADLENQRSDIK